MRQQQRRRACSKTRIWHIIQDLWQSVSIQNGPRRSSGWTSLQIPTAEQAHHQLALVERTIQVLKRSAEKLHEIHPQLSAEQVLSCVTSMHNEHDRIKGYSPFQWTLAHSRPAWNAEATDSTDPITLEQKLNIRTDAAKVYFANTCASSNLGA